MHRLIYLGNFIIELLDKDNNVLFRKDVRELNYPAPEVWFTGDVTILEVCPDSGASIETKLP